MNGIKLTEEEASVLRDLDDRLRQVKPVRLNIPIRSKFSSPPRFGYTHPPSPSSNANFDSYLTNNNNNNTYPHHHSPTSARTSSSPRRISPFASASTQQTHSPRLSGSPRISGSQTHSPRISSTTATTTTQSTHSPRTSSHEYLLNELRKERKKVEMNLRLSPHDNPDNPPLSSRLHQSPPPSSRSTHATTRHESPSSNHHSQYPSSLQNSARTSHKDKHEPNNHKPHTPRKQDGHESERNHKKHDKHEPQASERLHKKHEKEKQDINKHQDSERHHKKHSTTHNGRDENHSDKRSKLDPRPKENGEYFRDAELRELNERIKQIEMEFGVDPPKPKEPSYNGYLSSLLAPNPSRSENGSSKRMDYLPNDWTDEKSIMLPAPKLEIDELKPPTKLKTKKPKSITTTSTTNHTDQHNSKSDKRKSKKEPDSPPLSRSSSPLFVKRREVSAFASPQKVRIMSDDLPKPMLAPDRETRASSIRRELAKKKESDIPKEKKKVKKTSDVHFVEDPTVSLCGSFSPPMSRTVQTSKKKSSADDDKQIPISKSDMCLAHSVKKQKGKCPVCISLRRK